MLRKCGDWCVFCGILRLCLQPMKPAAEMQLVDGTTAVVRSEIMRKLMAMVERVAQQDAAVLIVGETGSGKEMVAKAIHQHSLRCGKPFVDVNCAAFPEHLVESELFGYEKGAFSGADVTKPGLFEMSDQGTLLLDEIGELDGKVQAKLLRVLDGVAYYRLGGSRKVTVNVRVIAATNRNLEQEVQGGKFRRDLYHRLTQFQLQVPPLRERREDISALAEYFLLQHVPAATRRRRRSNWAFPAVPCDANWRSTKNNRQVTTPRRSWARSALRSSVIFV